jgi:ankyrin repeat protein
LHKCKKSEMHLSSEMAVYRLLQYTSENDLENIKKLLDNDNNIDINKSDYDNRTALHIACQHGYWDIVSYLIDNNVASNIRDVNGCLAYDYIEHSKLNGYYDKEKIISYFNK